ncbi:WD repeat-containing protein 18 isoform X2 [Tachysurus fulvidraco]|uniref:WD repeat-containing protein 18 isoform X2 n=1 Tax=Tachysurus fulvidraco TaxID=1234273 RepID=UPI001FEFF1AE|nr:WD repeat-containing protein 18 isoform X2 [Tachysurus fulvidraco]
MSAPMEVVVTADSAGQLWNCAIFDPHTGTNLLSYRGGNSSARSLTVLNGEYILGAQLGKNFINVWEIQRKDQLQQKIVCPGVVTCLTASPDGLYVLAGIAEAIYLWEVSTGNLLVVLNRHYQDLSCLRFTDDCSHFVSGGKDNLALVWNLASIIQLDSSRTPEPRHVFSRHSLPITDIHCGLMGPQARVATASLDQTVKLWEISSGEMLLSVLFDVSIMSVTLDPCEYFLFCGGSDGNVFQVSLCNTAVSRDKTFQSDGEGNQVFKGHRNLVTCLSVSMDGTLLLSGSHDETVRMWDIQSKQCIRCINHKGAGGNVPGESRPTPFSDVRCYRQERVRRWREHQNTCVRVGRRGEDPEENQQRSVRVFHTAPYKT